MLYIKPSYVANNVESLHLGLYIAINLTYINYIILFIYIFIYIKKKLMTQNCFKHPSKSYLPLKKKKEKKNYLICLIISWRVHTSLYEKYKSHITNI